MIALLLIMTAISASLRLIPFIFSKWLSKWSLLAKFASTLPVCISILLVAHFLENVPFTNYPFGIPEVAAIIGVIIVHMLFRIILLSMGVGVLLHQILLYYL